MKINLTPTDSRAIANALVDTRDTGVQAITGRVLTLIVVACAQDDVDKLVDVAKNATREHPARVLVLSPEGDAAGESSLDATLLFGGDTGASEIIVMKMRGELQNHMDSLVTPLLLPDTPIVAWWPSQAPADPSSDPIGRIAQRRITDSFYDTAENALERRRSHYTPGDSDLAWPRITLWRGVLASSLDRQPRRRIVGAEVTGPAESPSVDLACGWLSHRLDIDVTRYTEKFAELASPVFNVVLHRDDADPIVVESIDRHTMRVFVPGSSEAHVAVSRRSLEDCLAEELRYLEPDKAYAEALGGLGKVRYSSK